MQHQQRAVRRLVHAGLSRGWSSWVAIYEEGRYTAELIKRTHGRFFHVIPSLKGAFYKWHDLRDQAHTAAVTRKADAAAGLAAEVSRLASELAEVKSVSSRQLAREREEVEGLRKRCASLAIAKREHEQMMEARLEGERQERIQALAKAAARRVQHAAIYYGPNTLRHVTLPSTYT